MSYKCPVCGSENVEPDYDNVPRLYGERLSVLFDCHDCLSDWLAVFEFKYNEEIYYSMEEEA